MLVVSESKEASQTHNWSASYDGAYQWKVEMCRGRRTAFLPPIRVINVFLNADPSTISMKIPPEDSVSK
jgi:hypothetical protein